MRFKRKNSLDRKISTVKEMISKWNKLISIYVRSRNAGRVSSSDEEESLEIFVWLQKTYPIIAEDMQRLVKTEYYDPLLGIHIKNIDHILNLIMSVGSMKEILSHRLRREFENDLRSGRSHLNFYLGFLENKKASIGEIDVREYEALKTFYKNNIKENERLNQREELAKKLVVKTKKFKTAEIYFSEAKSCFIYGFFRSSVIVAMSALESCLTTDYRKNKNEDYEGKFYNLLNRYFSGDLRRLPKQYEDFSKTYLKIRNSLAHPEDFNFSENIVYNVLSTVAELINHIDKLE